MKFSKHIEKLSNSLKNPATLSPEESNQIIILLKRLLNFEHIKLKSKQEHNLKMAKLSGKIMHLKRIAGLANALYWGDSNISKTWEQLIVQIESYNRTAGTPIVSEECD